MERNSKDHFLFCKTRNCFSFSLTKVLWETSNATRSDLFLLRRILVWHFSSGWIFFKLTRKSFQQKQIRIAVLKMKLTCPFEQIYHQDVMAVSQISLMPNMSSMMNFSAVKYFTVTVTAGFPYFNQLSLCWLRSNHFCEDVKDHKYLAGQIVQLQMTPKPRLHGSFS